MLARVLPDTTVGMRNPNTSDVVARGTVAQCARAGGVARNRTPDRCVILARRIGREQQTMLRQLTIQVADSHTRLDTRNSSDRIDVDDPVHAKQ